MPSPLARFGFPEHLNFLVPGPQDGNFKDLEELLREESIHLTLYLEDESGYVFTFRAKERKDNGWWNEFMFEVFVRLCNRKKDAISFVNELLLQAPIVNKEAIEKDLQEAKAQPTSFTFYYVCEVKD